MFCHVVGAVVPPAAHTVEGFREHNQVSLLTIIVSAGMWLVAPSPFFHAQWRQHRHGSECGQLFAEVAPKYTVHALVSRADFSAEAKKLSLQHGSDLPQVLAQVKIARLV